MSEKRSTWLIGRGHWFLLSGFALFWLASWFEGLGLVTGVAAVCLGSCCGCFQKWRTDPGLWLLSGFFLVMLGPLCLLLFLMRIRDFVRQVPELSPLNALEFSLASSLFWVTANVLVRVTIVNWRVEARRSSG